MVVAGAMGMGCVVLEDCGHVPYVEQPAGLFPPLLAFLKGSVARVPSDS